MPPKDKSIITLPGIEKMIRKTEPMPEEEINEEIEKIRVSYGIDELDVPIETDPPDYEPMTEQDTNEEIEKIRVSHGIDIKVKGNSFDLDHSNYDPKFGNQ